MPITRDTKYFEINGRYFTPQEGIVNTTSTGQQVEGTTLVEVRPEEIIGLRGDVTPGGLKGQALLDYFKQTGYIAPIAPGSFQVQKGPRGEYRIPALGDWREIILPSQELAGLMGIQQPNIPDVATPQSQEF